MVLPDDRSPLARTVAWILLVFGGVTLAGVVLVLLLRVPGILGAAAILALVLTVLGILLVLVLAWQTHVLLALRQDLRELGDRLQEGRKRRP